MIPQREKEREHDSSRFFQLEENMIPPQGDDNSHEKQVQGHIKPDLSLGTPQSCPPHPFTDPYFGGAMAAYGSHSVIHPQLVRMRSFGRVPLPLEPAEDEPIYVNAKQYNGILRRRQLRAKLEAQNKLVKERKPYLHESRHKHAMKRARGSGGRFLNKKELEQQSEPMNGFNMPGSVAQQLVGGERSLQKSENFHSGNGIEIVSMSESRHSFATSLRPHNGGNIRGWSGMIFHGSSQRVPVMR